MVEYITMTGYRPGIIGKVTELHATYYSINWNFGHYFEGKVATELSEFISYYNPTNDCIWSLIVKDSIEGSLTIDRTSEKENIAHLRWFIISDRLRGRGAGNHLMKEAISFCENANYERIYLWTFQGLNPARHLYEKFGFQLTEERAGEQWGTVVTEQRFDLELSTY